MALRRVGGVGHPLSSASAALFTAPGQAAPLWPWKLTPLLAQATAAWLISMGVARGAGAAGAGHVPPASRRTGSAQQSPLDHSRHLHVRPAGATSWRPVAYCPQWRCLCGHLHLLVV